MPIISGVVNSSADKPVIPVAVDLQGNPQVDVLTQPILIDGLGHAQIDIVSVGVLVLKTTYTNLNLAAGGNLITLGTVPAGRRWNITYFYHMVNTAAANAGIRWAWAGINSNDLNPIVSGRYVAWLGYDIWLAAGDTFQVYVYNVNLNDDLYCAFNGLEYLA